MTKNYDRYEKKTTEQYEKRTVMSYLCRIPSDRKLIPILSNIKGKNILDVGLGTGYYTRIMTADNRVAGVDQNPHLCVLDIKVHKGDATQLSSLVGGETFDIVLSTWMTEYLSSEQLDIFFKETKAVLNKNGKLITTVISKYGYGFMYITAARLIRGISKYNYKKKDIVDKLRKAGFENIQIINLNSWLGIPWAYLVTSQ